MDDRDETGLDRTGRDVTVVSRRRRPDPVTLLAGLLALGMATAAFVGEVPSFAGFDPRWLLAAGAALIGLLLLVGSLRGRGTG